VVASFRARPAVPVFPRWAGYYNLWIALLVLPATMIMFFRDGPFAWTGLIGVWSPAAVFGSWYLVMTCSCCVPSQTRPTRIVCVPTSTRRRTSVRRS
jgi:hypothetical protein